MVEGGARERGGEGVLTMSCRAPHVHDQTREEFNFFLAQLRVDQKSTSDVV